MKKILITVVLTLSIFITTSIFASDPTVLYPVTNIQNGVVSTKNSILQLNYQHQIVVDENTVIELYENGILVNSVNSVDGNILNVDYEGEYAPLKTYRLVVTGILSNDPDIMFSNVDTTFKYSSLTSFVFGQSVKGRDLVGYTLGEGSQVYMLIGGIHGDERNASRLVTLLLNNFKKNEQWIPADTKIVFVPNLNPDGYIKNTRMNARYVDLNRNANTLDWKARTYIGYKSYRYGGGRYPNSEPETRAIINLIKIHKPYLSISYHSAGGYVLTNGKYVRNLAKSYAYKSRYKYIDQSSGGVGFTYPITGDLTTWMYEKGYKGLTVELKSREYTEVTPNLNAVKYIISNY